MAQDINLSRIKIKFHRYVSIFLLVIVYSFSIISVQDYLAWNRAAWIAGEELISNHNIKPKSIRNLDSFNGWYNSDSYMKTYQAYRWGEGNVKGKGPFVFDDQYFITADSLSKPGYQVFDEVTYFSWLSQKEHKLIIWKRDE
ncbi:MAG: hypothetical protein QNJ33_06990 [Crocosphaera sp.]|nr:hypothetical protein [Crocosphaera sp.]